MTSTECKSYFKRVLIVILDSVGIGAVEDAKAYGDSLTVNTLKNTAQCAGPLKMPHMEALGLGKLGEFSGIATQIPTAGSVQCLSPKSRGKDTTTGHWEIAGLITNDPFQTFEQGFPAEMIQRFLQDCGLDGILANHTASGTEVIKHYGEEHLRTGKPIVYTSADSVFQIACHEESFGLSRLYEICEKSRKICDDYRISRVIARPFLGQDQSSFVRTTNRKDYSIALHGKMLFDYLAQKSILTHTVGKVANIYNFQSVATNVKTLNNDDGINKLIEEMNKYPHGLLVLNLLDFDQEYGHRRNVQGYATALEKYDMRLCEITSRMNRDDLLVITADHGNDPTAPGTDHTREKVPFITYSPRFKGGTSLEEQKGYDHIGGTVFEALTGETPPFGASIMPQLKKLR